MKCLVTKLQVAINDDFLPFVGEGVIDGALFDWNVMPNGLRMSFQAREPFSVRVAGNGAYAVDSSDVHYTNKDVPKDTLQTANLYNPNGGKVKLFVGNKNQVNRLFLNYDADTEATFPISLFSQFPTIERIGILTNIQQGGAIPVIGDLDNLSELSRLILVNFNVTSDRTKDSVYGDISVFSDKTNLEVLNFSRTRVSGSIASLKTLKNLTYLDLSYTEVTGTVEEFCTGLNQNGRKSGTLDLRVMNSNITYQGSALTSNKTVTFTSSGYTVS